MGFQPRPLARKPTLPILRLDARNGKEPGLGPTLLRDDLENDGVDRLSQRLRVARSVVHHYREGHFAAASRREESRQRGRVAKRAGLRPNPARGGCVRETSFERSVVSGRRKRVEQEVGERL